MDYGRGTTRSIARSILAAKGDSICMGHLVFKFVRFAATFSLSSNFAGARRLEDGVFLSRISRSGIFGLWALPRGGNYIVSS